MNLANQFQLLFFGLIALLLLWNGGGLYFGKLNSGLYFQFHHVGFKTIFSEWGRRLRQASDIKSVQAAPGIPYSTIKDMDEDPFSNQIRDISVDFHRSRMRREHEANLDGLKKDGMPSQADKFPQPNTCHE